jgi:phosphoribosylamine--glycine ligase
VKVLVIGGGGREHALVWKIAQSPQVDELFCAPGNPGIAEHATCLEIGTGDFEAIEAFVLQEGIGLVVVGPEAPLADGLVDRLAHTGAKVFGPSKAAAELEASKSFAKRLMQKYGIPTGGYREFDEVTAAIDYVQQQGAPLVVKADGLAAGKGVTVAYDTQTAVEAIRACMESGIFGAAGRKVIVEECLVGEEASILAFSDGKTVVPMMASQDHKPVYDGDQGPNTGGMGAYAPAPVVSDKLMAMIEEQVLRPCVAGMAAEGRPYKGVLYAGLIITSEGPKVIEFNCRFGDPETQVILPQLESDVVDVLIACCDGTLDQVDLRWRQGACVSVVMASGGYPGAYEKGKAISGIAEAEAEQGVVVFHAGTARDNGELVSNGGRVLNVTAVGDSIPSTIEKAYRAVEQITFQNAHYRTDIGKKAFGHL